MADKFVVGSRVFAKMKGYPHWPGKIFERIPGKEEKYKIYFYGTHDEGILKADQIVLYSDESKAKYGKPQRKPKFNEGLDELEKDVEAEAEAVTEEEEEAPEETPENEAEVEEKAAESEGELMIDEGSSSPTLPPVLTREISKTETPETGKKRPRTLSKRDSLTSASNNATAPVLTTPDPPPPEIVSRSGRKIKPKRFADDEISTPTKGGKGAASGEDGGPPAKRAKRGSKSVGKATAPPVPDPSEAENAPETEEVTPEVTPVKSKGGAAKGRNSNAAAAKANSRLSPDIVTSPANRGPPELKAASTNARNRRSSTSNKPLPALISAVKAPARKSGRQTRQKSTEQKIEAATAADEKEDIKPATTEENENVAETFEFKQPVAPTQISVPLKKRASAQKDIEESSENKVTVTGRNGLHYELSYDSEMPDATGEDDRSEWNAIAAQNVEKLKVDLVHNEAESQEIINSTAETIENIDVEEVKLREKRAMQIRLLRLEGEVIEIIGEIVGCLSISSADCDRTIELLNRLASHQLNKLMLKKHPEVVDTIKKLRCYIGNVEVWNLDDEHLEQFEQKALAIRSKAVEVYKNFHDLFCSSPEESFSKVFWEEVEDFNKMVADYPMKTILGLVEVDGQLYKFDSESANGIINEENTNGSYEEDYTGNGIIDQDQQDMYEDVED